jgi:hypothetical protein
MRYVTSERRAKIESVRAKAENNILQSSLVPRIV